MCEAIVKGLIAEYPGVSLSVCEAYESRRQYLAKTYPDMQVFDKADAVLSGSEVVIIAVKPQQLSSAFAGLKCPLGPLYVSICAGIPLFRLEKELGSCQARIARVMPNLPAMVAEGASGFCLSNACTDSDAQTVRKIFSSVGDVVEEVPESLMDALTSISGSGPAYVCLMIEAMADAGVREGLSRDVALRLAAQTCIGAGRMVIAAGEHPAVLKDKICSPGGTSIVGVAALESHGFRAGVMAAVAAVAAKSKELGKL